jgi:hypothetical protein
MLVYFEIEWHKINALFRCAVKFLNCFQCVGQDDACLYPATKILKWSCKTDACFCCTLQKFGTLAIIHARVCGFVRFPRWAHDQLGNDWFSKQMPKNVHLQTSVVVGVFGVWSDTWWVACGTPFGATFHTRTNTKQNFFVWCLRPLHRHRVS